MMVDRPHRLYRVVIVLDSLLRAYVGRAGLILMP